MLLILGGLIVDLLFLAAVALLNWLADKFVFNRLDLDRGPTETTVLVMQWAFALSTVGLVVVYLISDTYRWIRSSIRRARHGDT